MFAKKLKHIKKFSILIVPEDGSHGTRSQKLTPAKVTAILGLYSFVVFVLSGLLFAFTPVRSFFATESNLSNTDLQKIEELNEKMLFLTGELESLKSTNNRLRHAILLGDSTLADSISSENKSRSRKNKSGGNLMAVIRDLFFSQDGRVKEEPLYYFYSPSNGFISREYFPEKGHFGVDYVLKTGSPVYSAANGYIIFSDYTVNDGYMVIISHSMDYVTIYKHCSVLIKREREVVEQGELIALSGNTGRESIGPHLHFELWKEGKPVNPQDFLLNFNN
ncbi:MAG: M23 family metallopeptidase [Ignavibacteriaceae bacterium]